MPYINVRIIKDGVTEEQKAEVIRGITQIMVDVLGKDPQSTFVVIDEVDTDNWGIAGETLTKRRKKAGK